MAKKKAARKQTKKNRKTTTARKTGRPKLPATNKSKSKPAKKSKSAKKSKKKKPAVKSNAVKKNAAKSGGKKKKTAKKIKPKSLGRPRIAGDARLDQLFQKDYQAREIFDFLGVSTLKELETHGPEEIIERLTGPMVQTVQRIRKTLAMVNRSLADDRNFALDFKNRLL